MWKSYGRYYLLHFDIRLEDFIVITVFNQNKRMRPFSFLTFFLSLQSCEDQFVVVLTIRYLI